MPDTISELIECYRSDPHSSFAKLGYSVKIKHGRLLARIVRDHGQVSILALRNRDLIVWHQAWLGDGKIAMAHASWVCSKGSDSIALTSLLTG
jgi:hypothetical protein